jgi:DNA-directed RNA polymerase subunit F
METLKKEVISLSEVKDVLEKVEIEEMDQIQRWTYDYVLKFAKSPSQVSRKIINELVSSCDLKEDEAVEIANAMPNSIEELRAFTFGWKKLILTDTLNKILDIIKKDKESINKDN